MNVEPIIEFLTYETSPSQLAGALANIRERYTNMSLKANALLPEHKYLGSEITDEDRWTIHRVCRALLQMEGKDCIPFKDE